MRLELWGTHLGRASQGPRGHLGQGPPSQTPVQFSAVLFLAPGSESSPQRHGTALAPTVVASAVQPSAFLSPAPAGWPGSGQIFLLPFSIKKKEE